MDQTETCGAVAEQPFSATYSGRLADSLRLASLNAVLTVLTLGFYRFWARTRYRRLVWREIRLGDEPLEYTGHGIHLFTGFVVALVIVVPLGVLGELIATLEPSLSYPVVAVNVATLYFLLQVGRYRARRYRLSHTLWRGIRCDQTGSAFAYGLAALGGSLVLVLTLGLVKPWYDAMLFRRRWNNTWFGDHQFRADPGTEGLWWRWIMIYVILGLTVAAIWTTVFEGPPRLPTSDFAMRLFVIVVAVSALPVIAVAAIALPWYRIAQVRLFASRITFSDGRFVCSLKFRQVLAVGLAYGASMLFVLVFLVLFGLAITKDAGVSLGPSSLLGTIVLVCTFVAAWVAHSILYQGYAVPRVIAKVYDSLSLTAAESPVEMDLVSIRQGSRPAMGMGEGLVGLLDVGGFV